MLSINYLIEKKYPLDHTLSIQDKRALVIENSNKNYSYVSLMFEMFAYEVTVKSVLDGWGGVKVFTL